MTGPIVERLGLTTILVNSRVLKHTRLINSLNLRIVESKAVYILPLLSLAALTMKKREFL